MGDEDNGFLQYTLQPHQLGLHLAADQRIEGGERFVEKPDLGLHRERSGDANALLLAAGEFRWKMPLAAGQAYEVDHLGGAGLALLAANALDEQRESDILQHIEMRQKRKVLEHHAHLVTAKIDQFRFAGFQEIAAVEYQFASRRFDQSGQTAHQRRFARSRQAHDDEDFTLADLKRHVADSTDQMRLFEFCRRRLAVAGRQKFGGMLAKHLPQIAAG